MAKGKLIGPKPGLAEIPGYDGRYVADVDGTIYRVYSSGLAALMPQRKKCGMVVRLSTTGGKRREVKVSKAMQAAYLGPTPPGKVLYHKNRDKYDDHLANLGFISRQRLGQITGGSAKRQPVAKVSPNNSIVAVYPSARQAAVANFMSYQTVNDYCNGKTKASVAGDGYLYRWDDEEFEERGSYARGETAARLCQHEGERR